MQIDPIEPRFWDFNLKIPYNISFSAASVYATCPRKWYWMYGVKIVPAYDTPWLSGGKAGHAALNVWDNHHDVQGTLKKFIQLYQPVAPDDSEVNANGFPKCKWALSRYYDRLSRYMQCYSKDLKQYTNLGTEVKFGKEGIPIQLTPTLRLNGYTDQILKDQLTGEILVRERKFCSQLGYSFMDKFETNGQIDLNLFAVQQRGLDCLRVMLDAICMRTGDDRKNREPSKYDCLERKIIMRTPQKIESAVETIKAIWNQIQKSIETRNFPKMGIYSGACHDYGACPYKNLCTQPHPDSVAAEINVSYKDKEFTRDDLEETPK